MASTTTDLINTLVVNFPVAGQDNDSQQFRTNNSIVKQSLLQLDGSVQDLQISLDAFGSGGTYTATHLVARQDVTIGNDIISVDENDNLVVTANGKAGTIVMRPNTVVAYGAFALTDSVTNTSTGTFAVDDVRNIQIGATLTFPNISGLFTVAGINTSSNLITVTPQFADSPAPFDVGDALVFTNPFFGGNASLGDLIVNGSIYATGNITAFYGSSSDSRLKENVRTIENALDKVKQLSGVMYDWTDNYLERFHPVGSMPKADTGLIAQDVQQVMPEIVTTDGEGYLGVRYEKLAGLIIEAIKDLSAEIDEIKKKLP